MYVDVKDRENQKDIVDFLNKAAEKDKTFYWRSKRFFDIVFCFFAICILLIPMAIVYVLIFLEDGANPIYKQERVGRHGKIFNIYKFRTMVPNADKLLDNVLDQNEMDGPVFKIKNDPRITKLGKFLRATSLDELPQLFNVIKGDMTLIGPRPPLQREVEMYTEYQKLRLIITPGVTCIWQVQPKRNEISFENWVEMDLEYILKRSVLLDIKIVFLTIVVMFRGEGE